jgi:hypothetical protein
MAATQFFLQSLQMVVVAVAHIVVQKLLVMAVLVAVLAAQIRLEE